MFLGAPFLELKYPGLTMAALFIVPGNLLSSANNSIIHLGCLYICQSVTIWGKCDFLGCYWRCTAEILNEDSYNICSFCPSVCQFERHKPYFKSFVISFWVLSYSLSFLCYDNRTSATKLTLPILWLFCSSQFFCTALKFWITAKWINI